MINSLQSSLHSIFPHDWLLAGAAFVGLYAFMVARMRVSDSVETRFVSGRLGLGKLVLVKAALFVGIIGAGLAIARLL
jgi:hypothetical protein